MRLITWIALVLTAAWCGESTGPLSDLSGLRSSLAPVHTVFASPLVPSLGICRFSGPLPAPAAGPGSDFAAASATGRPLDAAAKPDGGPHHAGGGCGDSYSHDMDRGVQHAAGSGELKCCVGWFIPFGSWDEIVSLSEVPFAKV